MAGTTTQIDIEQFFQHGQAILLICLALNQKTQLIHELAYINN